VYVKSSEYIFQCLYNEKGYKREHSESPWPLNDEDTEQMYSKHLSV